MTHCWDSHAFCCLIVYVSCAVMYKKYKHADRHWIKRRIALTCVLWRTQGWHSRIKCSKESQAGREARWRPAPEHLTRARNASKRQASTFNWLTNEVMKLPATCSRYTRSLSFSAWGYLTFAGLYSTHQKSIESMTCCLDCIH
jgi:hypothetical protein